MMDGILPYSLPWAIGPLPIFVTIWSGLIVVKAILFRDTLGAKVFLSIFFLPIGLVAMLSQAALSDWAISVILPIGQVSSAILFIILFLFLNYLNGSDILPPVKEEISPNTPKMMVIFFTILVIFDVVVIALSLNRNTDSENYSAIVLLMGSRVSNFGTFYFANIIGSFEIILITAGAYGIVASKVRNRK